MQPNVYKQMNRFMIGMAVCLFAFWAYFGFKFWPIGAIMAVGLTAEGLIALSKKRSKKP